MVLVPEPCLEASGVDGGCGAGNMRRASRFPLTDDWGASPVDGQGGVLQWMESHFGQRDMGRSFCSSGAAGFGPIRQHCRDLLVRVVVYVLASQIIEPLSSHALGGEAQAWLERVPVQRKDMLLDPHSSVGGWRPSV